MDLEVKIKNIAIVDMIQNKLMKYNLPPILSTLKKKSNFDKYVTRNSV